MRQFRFERDSGHNRIVHTALAGLENRQTAMDFDRPIVKSYIKELAAQRRRVATILALSIVLTLPYIFGLVGDSHSGFNAPALYLAIALCLLGMLSRVAFVLSSTMLIFATVVVQHLERHWGFGQLSSRLEAFYDSPPGETLEYLRSYIDYVDVAWIVGSIAFVLFLVPSVRRLGLSSRLMRASAATALLIWCAGALVFRMDLHARRFPPLELAYYSIEAKQRYAQVAGRAST